MIDKPILIVGGTRGTGLLIARLLEQRVLPVRVLARDPARAKATLGPGVQVIAGDVTKKETLPRAIEGTCHIIFTAGCRSGHPASETQIKATEYDGVLNALASAQRAGPTGRFMYMTSSGVATRSLVSACLNLYKGNTLVWRRRAEDAIRGSGLDYTIIRTGMLQNGAAGRRVIELTQEALPLSIRYRIARADVAEAFAAALDHPRASRATFEIVWAGRGRPAPWPALFERLKPDAPLP
ncbi:MAG TPA: NAD(P)H-binding protein [Candidatus Eisenbacteria bacterium]|nr:NAD(P)H-binding protein [Candidatus Eisenbacteria bacterium]